jgi:putative flippase GtrA
MHNQEYKKEGIYFYAIETSRKLLKIDFVRFGVVGAGGFLVNLSVLFILHDILNLPLWISQLTGAEVALLSNFTLHHFWTFRNRAGKKRKRILLAQFHVSFWSGALINSSIVIAGNSIFNIHYAIGLVLGSATAMFWNFFWTKFYIWRHSPHQEHDLPEES